MGRFCSFPSSSISAESLAASWDLCLEHISRYADFSTTARKSHEALRESAQRLLHVNPNRSRSSGVVNEEPLNQDKTYLSSQALSSCAQANVPPVELQQSRSNLPHPNHSFALIGTGQSLEVDQPVAVTNEPNKYLTSGALSDAQGLNSTYEDELSAHVPNQLSVDDWADLNSVVNQNLWSLTPYLPQLEGFSPKFGHLDMF